MLKVDIIKHLTTARGPMELNLSFSVPKGKRVAVYGESGSGKTSLLRMIAGLMEPDSGTISSDDHIWFSNTSNIPSRKRHVGLVFQDYALFPNMSVQRNLEYAAKSGSSDMINKLVDLFELEGIRKQFPSKLSGGQQQRVALARALIRQPEIFLLDEPLSALDFQLRRKIQDYLLEAHKEFNFTMLLVTHDHGEILRIADWLIWLENGKIHSEGPPAEILSEGSISGKFKVTGEIIRIHKDEIIDIFEILVGNEIIQVVVDRTSASGFSVGDKVLVTSKAFNPVIQRIDN